jgi:hypothetical protein
MTTATVTLTVRTSVGELSRRLHLPPCTRLHPGAQIDITYDPDDPATSCPSGSDGPR